jgi:hypothetical protein
MRLDDARLCLDCEEIHEEQECPACGSEAFAFLTRWIQSTAAPARPARRPAGGLVEPLAASSPGRPDADRAHKREQLAAWRQIVSGVPAETAARGRKIVTRSLLGLAAAGLAGWVWSKSAPEDDEGPA